MATRTPRKASDDTTPRLPESTPPPYSQPGHDFTLQAVMELQKTVGEMNANLVAMRSSLDSVKSKVDDLIGWKHKIVGGVAVLIAVGGVAGFVIGKASDYLTWRTPATMTPPSPTAQPPATQPPAAPLKP